MTQDEQDQLAWLIGRDLAYERAVMTLIGSPRRGEPLVITDLLRANFQMGRDRLSKLVQDAGLPASQYRMAEDGFAKVSTAILNGVVAHKYLPPAR